MRKHILTTVISTIIPILRYKKTKTHFYTVNIQLIL